MTTVSEFPHKVNKIENAWIPLADGTRLAARLWMPEDAPQNPVPAIFEYLPYRKNDGTVLRDLMHHPYFAGHGYASVRVDMRGTGDSDGILYDEYLPQEQADALEVLCWIANQPWCDGQVGIIGISWGGFNGLQIAAHNPPALKTIITICSTDDRYADDVHYMGGCLLGSDMLSWASTMFAYNALPPDPRFVGERWREMWFERMENTPPYVEAWLSHQRRDEFWKQGSVNEDFNSIRCPVYAVGGWVDPYTNAVFRLLEGLNVPRKGLIGPWSHNYPEYGVPGPAIGFLQECLRWWDHWMKGADTGIMEEPMLRMWMLESAPPRTFYEHRPGRWVAEPAWPSGNEKLHKFTLDQHRLVQEAAEGAQLRLRGSEAAGMTSGVWCPYGRPGELPGDQRIEDGLALSFTSAPLVERMEIAGFPEATLEVAADRPNALLAVRLCDVHPDGASTLVTWGLLNLTHRNSHEDLSPLEPGEKVRVTVRLNAIAYSLPAGHCWRLAVSPAFWPHAWPSPEPVTLSLFTGEGSYLTLPVRKSRAGDADLRPFDAPEWAEQDSVKALSPGTLRRSLWRDLDDGTIKQENLVEGGGIRLLNDGLEKETLSRTTYTIVEGDPLSARVECAWDLRIQREEWSVRIETNSKMFADAEHFHTLNVLQAFEGNSCVFTKTWDFKTRRDLV